MLEHAPDSSGQRYVAIVLHIANKKGIAAITDAAKAWLDYPFFPSQFMSSMSLRTNLLLDHLVLTLSKSTKTVRSSSQTPTLDDTATQIQIVTRAEQHDLRAAVSTSLSFFFSLF